VLDDLAAMAAAGLVAHQHATATGPLPLLYDTDLHDDAARDDHQQ